MRNDTLKAEALFGSSESSTDGRKPASPAELAQLFEVTEGLISAVLAQDPVYRRRPYSPYGLNGPTIYDDGIRSHPRLRLIGPDTMQLHTDMTISDAGAVAEADWQIQRDGRVRARALDQNDSVAACWGLGETHVTRTEARAGQNIAPPRDLIERVVGELSRRDINNPNRRYLLYGRSI